MKQRLAPFLILLDARYLPLLLLAVPQSFVISFWLYDSNIEKRTVFLAVPIGVFGFFALEGAYIGSIAWAGAKSGFWFWATSVLALAFSVGVAVAAHWQADEYLAILHAGFPLVAFCYTMTIHKATSNYQAEPKQPDHIAPAPKMVQPETYAADSGGGVPNIAELLDNLMPLDVYNKTEFKIVPQSIDEIREAFKSGKMTYEQVLAAGVNPNTARGWKRNYIK